jgi:hypothetical protein
LAERTGDYHVVIVVASSSLRGAYLAIDGDFLNVRLRLHRRSFILAAVQQLHHLDVHHGSRAHPKLGARGEQWRNRTAISAISGKRAFITTDPDNTGKKSKKAIYLSSRSARLLSVDRRARARRGDKLVSEGEAAETYVMRDRGGGGRKNAYFFCR